MTAIIPELSDQPDEGGQVGWVHVVGGRTPDGQRVGREIILVARAPSLSFTFIRIRGRGGQEATKERGRSLLVIRQQDGADRESHPDGGEKSYLDNFRNKRLFLTWS